RPPPPPAPQPLSIVSSRLHLLAPVPMVEIPLHRVAKAVLEWTRGRPPELPPDFRRVDRITAIVAGACGDERLQRARAPRGGPQRVDRVADAIHDLEIRPLVAGADVV